MWAEFRWGPSFSFFNYVHFSSTNYTPWETAVHIVVALQKKDEKCFPANVYNVDSLVLGV